MLKKKLTSISKKKNNFVAEVAKLKEELMDCKYKKALDLLNIEKKNENENSKEYNQMIEKLNELKVDLDLCFHPQSKVQFRNSKKSKGKENKENNISQEFESILNSIK